MTNLFSLEGKVALVTGAAYGIGFAIAKIVTAALNLTRQPLLNGIKIILVSDSLFGRFILCYLPYKY